MIYPENQDPETGNRPTTYQHGDTAPVLNIGDWILNLIIISIPVLNIIALILWSLDSNINPNKGNWAKASLIIICIQVIVSMFLLGIFVGTLSHVFTQLDQMKTW